MVAAQRLRRRMRHTDHKLRDEYLAHSPVAKLHIGGGPRCLEGWLNADIALLPGVVQMDATQPFPFVDGVFNYIFTEHMIEHVPFQDGSRMLRECHRVLRTDGIIRITTPNLVSIVGLFTTNPSPAQQRYMNWFCKAAIAPDCPATPANAINAMFRLWGHQFIYDEETLAATLRRAGFKEISRHPLTESEHQELRNLENVQRYPVGLLEFESLALEARK